MSTRTRAVALLDILDHGGDADQTAYSVDVAHRWRSCLASYPLDALEWAWADNPKELHHPRPGDLDLRRSLVSESDPTKRAITAFGFMFRWLGGGALPEGTMVMSGRTGSGKNIAAMYAAVHRGGAYYLGSGMGDLALGDSPVLRDLATVPLLVLDELGRETAIGPTLARMVALLTARHDNRRATLITTNMTQAEFSKRYGEHLLDRVTTSGGYAEIVCPSKRTQGVKPNLTVLRRHCRIAELVHAVNTLTGTMPGNVPASAIDKLAAEYGITTEQIAAAEEKRRNERVEIPASLAGGAIGHVLRLAAGSTEDADHG